MVTPKVNIGNVPFEYIVNLTTRFYNSTGSDYTGIKGVDQASTITFTLPPTPAILSGTGHVICNDLGELSIQDPEPFTPDLVNALVGGTLAETITSLNLAIAKINLILTKLKNQYIMQTSSITITPHIAIEYLKSNGPSVLYPDVAKQVLRNPDFVYVGGVSYQVLKTIAPTVTIT